MARRRLTLASAFLWSLVARAAAVDAASADARDAVPNVTGRLAAWMQGLVIDLPENMTGELPNGMGDLTITNGSCWNLKLGGLDTEDKSSDLDLEFEVNIRDVEIQCHVEGENNGPVVIDIIVGKSNLNASVLIQPHYSWAKPDLPLPLGQMNLTSCSAAIKVNNVSIVGNSTINNWVKWFDEPALANMISMFVNQPLCDGLKDLVEVNGTEGAQEGALMVTPLLFPVSAMESPTPRQPLLDWDTYPPIIVIQALIKERFHLWSDRVIQILEVARFDGSLVSTDNVTMSMHDFEVEGVGPSTRPGMALWAADQLVGFTGTLEGLTLNMDLEAKVTLPGQPVLDEPINVRMGLDNVSMEFRAYVDEPMVENLEIDQAAASPKCFLECATVTSDPPSDAIAVEGMGANLRPLLKVSAPGELEQDVTNLVNTVVGGLYGAYMPAVNTLLNGGLGFMRSTLNTAMWERIDAMPPCKMSGELMGIDEHVILSFWLISIAIAAVGAVVAAVAQWRFNRQNAQARTPAVAVAGEVARSDTKGRDAACVGEVVDAEGAGGSSCAAAAAAGAGCAPEHASVYHSEDAPRPDVCLAMQPFVPRAVAVFFPFACASVAFIFLFADFGLGATVTVLMHSGEKLSVLGPVFSFSLISTVVHSWDSGAYFISIITIFMSGIWPYIKLSMMMVCWLAPPHKFSLETRGRVLNFLDTWGKYSFVDSWFLVLSMSAFALHWQSVGEASMKVQTNPTEAFYAFFAATGLSLSLGHLCSQYHTHALQIAEQSAEEGQQRERGAKPMSAFATNRFERVAIPWALGLSVLLIFVGTFVTSFHFEIDGLFTEFLFGKIIRKEYSLYSVGMAVAQERWHDAGLISLEVIFVVLAMIIPVVLLALLFVLWEVPMRPKRQERVLRACYFLESWSSLDVAVLVLLVACFEFGRLSEFLVYKSGFAEPCTLVKDMTRTECLEVMLSAKKAFSFLLVAGFCCLVVPKVVLQICARTVSERVGQPVLPGSSSMSSLPEVKKSGSMSQCGSQDFRSCASGVSGINLSFEAPSKNQGQPVEEQVAVSL